MKLSQQFRPLAPYSIKALAGIFVLEHAPIVAYSVRTMLNVRFKCAFNYLFFIRYKRFHSTLIQVFPNNPTKNLTSKN